MSLTKDDIQAIKDAFEPQFQSIDDKFKILATKEEIKQQSREQTEQIHHAFQDSVEIIYQTHPTIEELEDELQQVKSKLEELEERLEKVEKHR